MPGPQRILICDDQPMIHETLGVYLKNEGFEYCSAMNGQEATDMAESYKPDLIILDIMMPKLDGIHAIMKIREDSSIPIIVLSAKTQDTDKILGLNLGADDYVAKPFNPLELIARVKSQIRRYTNFGTAAEAAPSEQIYSTGGLVINDDRKEVTVDGEIVKLTRIEYNILLLSLIHISEPTRH